MCNPLKRLHNSVSIIFPVPRLAENPRIHVPLESLSRSTSITMEDWIESNPEYLSSDRSGNLANGAIANLVDIVGAAVAYVPGQSLNVSVDISISYMSTAMHQFLCALCAYGNTLKWDELEITSRMLGRVGGCSGTIVILRNKTTGEIIAEGRHSLFRSHVGPIPKL
ncbi:hypothetical protein L3X38_030838 [Prunus dulcis]|uniref:Thioesterase superfamily protein n=1 Tax=Prunus dulcis TaxID=3755 RepID=A0AAD4VD64_PRUDU|nr:hypothetical protein L3X38_030838 [Prunus dulcis]